MTWSEPITILAYDMSSPTRTKGYEIVIKVRYVVWCMHKNTSVVKSNTTDQSNKESVKLGKLEDLRKAASQKHKNTSTYCDVRNKG